jgi:thiol-disulfide isomerase/thioredoxin
MPTPAPSTPTSAASAAARARWLLRRAFELLLIVTIVLAVQAWRTRDVPDGPLPNFTVLLADGRYTTFDEWRAAHADGAMALYFWAEWCPICRTVQGRVDAITQDWPVLTVAMQSGDAAAVREFLGAQRLAWHTVVDEHGRLAADMRIPGVPAMLIIDREGRIRFTEIGFSTETGLRLRLWWANRSS